MAEEYVDEFLDSAGLEEYKSIFKDNGINNRRAFLALTGEQLNTFIREQDHRVRFTQYWREKYSLDFEVQPANISQVQQGDVPQEQQQNALQVQQDNAPQPQQINAAPVVVEIGLDDLNEWQIRDVLLNLITKENLTNWLKKSTLGRSILTSYEREKELTRTQRDAIVAIIVEQMQETSYLWNNAHFSKAANVLAGENGIFPSEEVTTYYVKNGSKPAQGKIPNKYRNEKQKKKENLGEVKRRKKEKKQRKAEQLPKQVVIPQKIQESTQWLSTNRDPEHVFTHWRITSDYRYLQIQSSKEKNVAWVFDLWILLKDAELAPQLISIDFEEHFTADKDAISKFGKFFCTLKKQQPHRREDSISNLEKLADVEVVHVSANARIVAQLSLLPFYYPPTGGRWKKKKTDDLGDVDQREKLSGKSTTTVTDESSPAAESSGSTYVKYSSISARDSLLQFVEVPADVENIRDAVRNDHKLRPIQPYIIAVGPCAAYVRAFLVVINDELLLTKTAAEAIDLCFKIFHVFHLEYPKEAEHIWKLIEQGLYALEIPYEPIPSIACALRAIKEVKKRNEW